MPHLAESTRLDIENRTIFAELATSEGYITSTLDLTLEIGNRNGKFTVGKDESISAEEWRGWFDRGFNGTILQGLLLPSGANRQVRANWVSGEVDLGQHVVWSGTELKFRSEEEEKKEEHECDDKITRPVGQRDQLEVSDGVLHATSPENGKQGTIDLNTKLGNHDGQFHLDGANFSMSTRNCTISGTTMCGELRKINGAWQDDKVDLSQWIEWCNGSLAFYTPGLPSQPVATVDCKHCRPLLRRGKLCLPLNNEPVHLSLPLGGPGCPICSFLRLIVRDACRSSNKSPYECVVTPSLYNTCRQTIIEVRLGNTDQADTFAPSIARYAIYNRTGMENPKNAFQGLTLSCYAELQGSTEIFQPVPRSSFPDIWFEPVRRWAFVQDWLTNCSTNHEGDCTAEVWRPLPARVLDLVGLGENRIRLVVTSGECERYACLSHCWGHAMSTTLTAANNDQFALSGIDVSSLPKTFRDAISICARLGIRYLWIDSLCIKQDSKLDWERESIKMASYYGNCFLCIAATSSSNSEAGCQIVSKRTAIKCTGMGPDGLPYRLLACPFDQIASFDSKQHFTQLTEDTLTEKFPLLRRAWAYQERHLSPRILHLCGNEVVLECGLDLTCECGSCKDYQLNWTKSVPRPNLRSYNWQKSTPEALNQESWGSIQSWRSACTAYSTLDLTFPTDKLAAISGLAKSSGLSGEYLAGLWTNYLLADLCWFVGPEVVSYDIGITKQQTLKDKERKLAAKDRPVRYVAPSWSWASVMEPISYCDIALWPKPTAHTTLLDAVMRKESESSMGSVATGSHLTLRGYIVETAWKYDLEAVGPDDRWFKLRDVRGFQGKFVLQGNTGWSIFTMAPQDYDAWNAEEIRFLPDYNIVGSTTNSIPTDEPLYLLPIHSEVTLIPIDKLKPEEKKKSIVLGQAGDTKYVDSDFEQVTALVLRRLPEHEVIKTTELAVYERVGFTNFVARKPLQSCWRGSIEANIILV